MAVEGQEALAYAAHSILNLDHEGKPLTYRSAMNGPNAEEWKHNNGQEIQHLFDLDVIEPCHIRDQPAGTKPSYYNPQVREKYKCDSAGVTYLERRVRGTVG